MSLYFHPAARYGGPIVSTRSLARALAERGFAVRVLTSDADGPRRLAVPAGWHEAEPGVAVRYCRRLGGQLGELVAPGMLAALPRELGRADVVYVSGLFVWLLPLLLPLALAARRPLMIAPRGMLLPEALATRTSRKRRFLTLLALLGAARATYHATSEEEASAIRSWFPRAPIVTIPNGIDIPPVSSDPRATASRETPLPAPPPPYLLFLGRLHPHKRLEAILEAFAIATAPITGSGRATLTAAELWIAGEGEAGYVAGLRELTAALEIGERVRFVGGLEGEAKGRALAGAAGLVLASRSESFGMVVAEALAAGTPCVVTRTAPWAVLESEGCGFWVENGALADGLRRLLSLPEEERRAMGEQGRRYVQRALSWEAVGDRMAAALADLGGGRL